MLEDLEMKENEWLEEQGIIPEDEWLEKGIVLYRDFLKIKPDNAQYKYCLARLLLEKGRDEKLRHDNYKIAHQLFNEVIKLMPKQCQAHYHLGVIAKHNGLFQEALNIYSLRRPEKKQV